MLFVSGFFVLLGYASSDSEKERRSRAGVIPAFHFALMGSGAVGGIGHVVC